MEPHLIAISGSLKGTTFPLAKDEISVGREASNEIYLNDPSISRRHCLIRRTSVFDAEEVNQLTIRDLESYNGTFVNGVPVLEQSLAHGDQIALGDVLFLFLAHEGGEEDAPAIQMDEVGLITRSTIRLKREEAFYLRPERVLAALRSDDRVARELNTLLKISNTINSIRDMRELQQRLLELILEVVPAERGATLLLDETREEFVSICGWSRLRGADDSIKVSKTITNQVLREVVALLSNDIFESENIGGTPSLVAARVCSLLCVPLILFDKPLGVIYLDTSDPTARFDEGHLQLLTAIAGIASVAFDNAERFQGLQIENQRLQEEVQLEHKMIGESAPMREIYRFLAKVAATQSTVLLRGESGTGKELAAHAIHLNSSRASKPFVAINCATLTETLLESELFGHEKGAFTGAIAQRRGKLEVADGGTVFLDEVGELTPMIQAKLLRVLQEREFERVGSTRPIKVDVRIIAATNKDLEAAIKSGGFRQDLYYRLNVVSIAMPPLRERREDISLLASFFTVKYSNQCKRRVSGISPEARNALRSYDWPGNVRELENAIERAVVLGSSDSIRLDDLPESLLESGQAGSLKSGYYETLRETKKQLITKMLEQTGGNYTEAAKLLGVHPNNLHRLIRSLNLKTSLKKT
ncbi:MAG: sigma 54-interacting transcriptional regulator [Pyrinomonadaceae bacterium]|nr:sigma 54-interacting transcriptional regulator [Pyrinomonadaceae bacterium]